MRRCSLALLALLAGCPGPPGDSGDVEVFDCELGFLDADDRFVAYTDDDRAELVLGFQGLLMVLTHVRAVEPPATCDALCSLELEGETPAGSEQPLVGFDAGGVSDEIVLFLPSAVPSAYEGRSAELAVRLDAPGSQCIATADVTLVDEDPCVGGGECD